MKINKINLSYVSTPTTHRACLTSTLSLFFYRLVLTTSRGVCHLLRLSSGRPSKCVKTTFTQTLSMRSASCSKRTNTRLLTDTSRSPTLLMLSRYPDFQEIKTIHRSKKCTVQKNTITIGEISGVHWGSKERWF